LEESAGLETGEDGLGERVIGDMLVAESPSLWGSRAITLCRLRGLWTWRRGWYGDEERREREEDLMRYDRLHREINHSKIWLIDKAQNGCKSTE
jgi:hypothetical protein